MKNNEEKTNGGEEQKEEVRKDVENWREGWRERKWEGRGHGNAVGAVILITLGIIFLLNNFGVLPWSIWGDLWRLWPVILVIVGLQIIVGGSWIANFLITLVGLTIIAYVIILSVAAVNPDFDERLRNQAPWLPRQHMQWITSKDAQHEQITIAESQYSGIADRRLTADVGTGKFTLKDDESTNYFDLVADFYANFGKPRVEHRQSDGTLVIDFDTEGGFGFFMMGGQTTYAATIGKPDMPSNIKIEVGTGSASAELDRAKIGDFDMKVGTGSATADFALVSLPSGTVKFDVGTGSIRVRLPKDTGLKIRHDVGTGKLRIDQSTIDGDGTFESENYASAASKLEFEVEVGTGSITVERF